MVTVIYFVWSSDWFIWMFASFATLVRLSTGNAQGRYQPASTLPRGERPFLLKHLWGGAPFEIIIPTSNEQLFHSKLEFKPVSLNGHEKRQNYLVGETVLSTLSSNYIVLSLSFNWCQL